MSRKSRAAVEENPEEQPTGETAEKKERKPRTPNPTTQAASELGKASNKLKHYGNVVANLRAKLEQAEAAHAAAETEYQQAASKLRELAGV